MALEKGQWCTAKQWRKVYAPACERDGCELAPLYSIKEQHWVEGHGDVMIRNIDDIACMDKCSTEARCVMYEHYSGSSDGGVKCNLFFSKARVQSGGRDATVGIKE